MVKIGITWNPAMSRFTRYNIMIQFVSNLPEVGGFLQVIPIFTINKTDPNNLNVIGSKNTINKIVKVGYGYICLREEKVSFNNNNIM
jgi:hypothetical protein